jgi:hypothetical protein
MSKVTGVAGGSAGCLYKGSIHPAGSQWDDGCDYRCTCKDAVTGEYACTAKWVHTYRLNMCIIMHR